MIKRVIKPLKFGALLSMFLFQSPRLACAGFPIVKDGIAQCVIVTEGALSPSEETGIAEFKKFVAEMSGAELQSRTSVSGGDGSRLVVGEEAVKKLYPDVDLAGLGDEGFLIKQQEKDLIIAGGKLRGTMYGLYTVLEDLGCRWLSYDESFIPKKSTLDVSLTDSRQVPKLQQRNIMYSDIVSSPWCARNKINRPGWAKIDPKYGGEFPTAGAQAHNVFALMDEAGVKVEEDMLCLKNGQRNKSQLCLTDPRVIEAFTKALIHTAKENPGIPYVHISQADNTTYCECPRCAEIDANAKSHSGQMVYCVNACAKELAKECPGTDIMFYAYVWTRKAPENMTLEPNTIVGLAFIESNYTRPLAEGHVEINRQASKDLAEWGKLTKKFFVWDYVVNYNNFNILWPNLDVLAPNVKFYTDHNVLYLMAQAVHKSTNAEFQQLRAWVLAKAMWNPELKNEDLIDDFLKHYYGPAAPAIQDYINITHTPGRTMTFKSDLVDRLNAPYLAPDVIAAAEVSMQKAETLASGNPDLERRIRHAHMPLWHVIAHRAPGGATWKAIEKATGKPVDLDHIVAQLKQILVDKPKNQFMTYGDGEPLAPWMNWLEDYAARVAKNGGKQPLPPELKDLDPSTFALVEACRMDGRSRWWQASDEGASDGWSSKIPTPGWTIRHYPMAGEDYTPGKKYEFWVRIKPGAALASSGKAFAIGDVAAKKIKQGPNPDWDISNFKPGEWKAVKIAELELDPEDGFYFATNPKVLSEYELDCYWLKEVTH